MGLGTFPSKTVSLCLSNPTTGKGIAPNKAFV